MQVITAVPNLTRMLLWLIIISVIGVAISLLAPILGPFVLAFSCAYILLPGVDWLTRKRIPHSIAVLIMIVLLLLILVFLALLVLFVLQRELPILREQLPVLLVHFNNWLQPKLFELGIDVRLDFPELQKLLLDHIVASPEEMMRRIGQTLVFSGSALLNLVSFVIFLPLLLFYLLKDWRRLCARSVNLIPPRWRTAMMTTVTEVDYVLARYLREQLKVMLILAAYYTVTLWLAGFEVAVPVGLLTGLAIFIPYIGFSMGLLLALLAALLQFGDAYGFGMVALIYGLGQIIESFFLTPMLVGERIGLHPLAVIFALLAFGNVFGFLGVLLALPISAIFVVLLRRLHQLYQTSALYK